MFQNIITTNNEQEYKAANERLTLTKYKSSNTICNADGKKYRQIKVLSKINTNTECKQSNKDQTEWMSDIQTSLECSEIEMEETSTITFKAKMNTYKPKSKLNNLYSSKPTLFLLM